MTHSLLNCWLSPSVSKGDITVLQENYAAVRAWIDCMHAQYNQTGLAQFYYHYGGQSRSLHWTRAVLLLGCSATTACPLT